MNARADYTTTFEAAYRDYSMTIAQDFTEVFAGKPRMIDWFSHSAGRILQQEGTDAVMESLEESGPRAAILAVLRDSECPLVQALRQEIIVSQIQRHGDTIASFRAGEFDQFLSEAV